MTRRYRVLLLSLGALALWAGVSAGLNDRGSGEALPYFAAAASLALGVTLGLLAARSIERISLVAVAVFLVAEVATRHPWSGAMGGRLLYLNAEAALAVQLAALPLLAGAATRRWRLGWWILSAVAVGVSVLSKSTAGMFLGAILLGVGGWALWARKPRARWVAVFGGVGVFALGALQLLLTARVLWPAAAVSALSSRRIDLWEDAVSLFRSSPTIGRGPGSFPELSPTAADPDTRAAHSILLQVLAELGLVGVVVLGVVLVAGLWVLQSAPARSRLVGVAAWCALWLHGLVDYVMHFPVVMLAGGLVVGAATGARDQSAEASEVIHDGTVSKGWADR